MLNDYQSKTYVEREAKQLIKIEKQGNIKTPKTFNNNFTVLQERIINLLKEMPDLCTSNGKISYGKIYLLLLQQEGLIMINPDLPDKILSPESPDRILRKLFEYAEFGNKELEFLLKFKDSNNEELNKESKEYYRRN